MFLDKKVEEKTKEFQQKLLDTNRGYNYYIDWSNVTGFEEYMVEIHAMDVLIHCDDEKFEDKFTELLRKLPTVIEVFPILFGLAKAERKSVTKKKTLKIIGTQLDSDDYDEINFNANAFKENMTDGTIKKYYDFFSKMGLKSLFQNNIEKSVLDYIVGVLIGMDSNGRKNRAGSAFELACEPIIRSICSKYGLETLIQRKFEYLSKKYDITISDDMKNRKADFIIVDPNNLKCMNIEVNFFNLGGSKPEEIIDAYSQRQTDLEKIDIKFALITDGNCWHTATNQLTKGFGHINYLLNYRLIKDGTLEEVIKREFGV